MDDRLARSLAQPLGLSAPRRRPAQCSYIPLPTLGSAGSGKVSCHVSGGWHAGKSEAAIEGGAKVDAACINASENAAAAAAAADAAAAAGRRVAVASMHSKVDGG